MNLALVGLHNEPRFEWLAEGLAEAFLRHGHRRVEDPRSASLVLNFVEASRPRPFRRKAQAVFVAAVTQVEPPFGHPMDKGYPLLVRSLANVLLALVPEGEALPTTHLLTLEQGHLVVPGSLHPQEAFEAIYQRLRPMATARLVLNNIFDTDLPPELWKGDPNTEAIGEAGRKLAELNLLPTPFPMDRYLSPRDRRHIQLLYGIGGLSYGNLSARMDDTRFWMSASGVDKSNLREIGRDILLVKGYDPDRNAMLLSVPPGVEPRRVSVDAIEHWMIYREHPEVGAILHVHAWMDGVPSTEVVYPCGTFELGEAVAALVRSAPVPVEAVVGLKNHGLTIVGRSMEDIFRRVEGKLYQPVPMS